MAVAAEHLSAVTREIQTRRIEDRQPDVVEQVAAFAGQLFLDQVLAGARRQVAALLIRKFVAEPGHRPAQMVQVDRRYAADRMGRPPFLRGAIRRGP